MWAFYDSLNQVDSIFSSKVIILPNNHKNYLEFNGLEFLGVSDTVFKILSCLILMRIFQNWPYKLHIISGSEKIASPLFHAVSFVCKNQEGEISKIKKRNQRDLYFTFNAILKYFNLLV